MAQLPGTIPAGELELRRLSVAYVDELFVAVAASFAELNHWMAWAQTMPDHDGLRVILESGQASFDADREWDYIVVERHSGEVVGSAGLRCGTDPQCPEIGYWVRSDRTGRGYATSAARALVEAAFSSLPDVMQVKIRMDQANLASAAVPPKLGFSLQGEEDREVIAKGHTGKGFVWVLARGDSARS